MTGLVTEGKSFMAEADSLLYKRDRTGNLCCTETQLKVTLDYSGFRSHGLEKEISSYKW